MPILFESIKREARFLSPLTNFTPITQTIEHRRDPLTNRSVIVLSGRLDYVKRFMESEESFIQDMVNAQEKDCPFCPDSIKNKAPKFTGEISAEGRIITGETVCFPSLFAHEDFNALVVPTNSHKLQLGKVSTGMFVDGFKACVQYFERVHSWMPEVKYNAIAMNFLPPAGSTIGHPHIHALASEIPFPETCRLLNESKSYFDKNGCSYWADLLETEQRLGVRFLGGTRGVSWLTPYAPMGLNECQGIVHGTASLDMLSDNDITGLAEGIVRVLKFYYDAGVRSFNMAVYSGPLSESLDYFDVVVRMVSRYGYKSKFVSDVWALQYLLGEQEVYESPEETCSKLKSYFITN